VSGRAAAFARGARQLAGREPDGMRALMTAVALAVVMFPAPVRTQAPPPAATRLEVTAPSKATYRVREQLARLNLPNDAVGETAAVTGVLVIRADGTFAPDSKLSVDLRTVKSDESRRDAFLRENTLHTDKFPFTEFVPKRSTGLANPLPASGTAKFQLTGDMTVHGTTAEQTWDVTATFAAGTVTASATTRFTFGKYGITQPKLLGLISVEDDIRLELNIRLRRSTVR
jgi:polyisoprenoid-binding protein YceI